MAQLIQHKRGVLEDLSGVTPNKGELLVVTGSSISALADGLVFVGNHSDLTSVNKILTGSSSPDLSSYDVGVNGIPFYNTTDKNLQILRQDGNLDVVLKHNKVDFGGSTIVSGSVLRNLNGAFSSSAQVNADSVTNFDSNVLAYINSLGVQSGSDSAHYADSDTLLYINSLGVISGSSQVNADTITNFDTNVQSYIRSIDVVSGSSQIDGTSIQNNTITIAGTSTALGGSITLATITNGTGIVSSSAQIEGDFLNTNGEGVISSSAQIDALGFLQVNGDGVISGSSQVNADTITNFDSNVQAYIRSIDVISGSSQVTGIVDSQISGVNHSKVDFGGSGITSGSLGLSIAGGSGTDTVQTGVDTLTFAGTANEIETTVTNNQVAIGIVTNPTLTGNVIITGDLTVNGDTVQTNVTTMNVEDNIINLNYGGSQTSGGIYVTDATGGNTISGSIIWDGTNDFWKAGAKDSEARVILGNGTDTAGTITKFSADGVITDSIITESGTTVTISNDLILSGLTASSFLVANASKQLVSVSTSTDGDILVSDGAGNFSVTNTIDGGTF